MLAQQKKLSEYQRDLAHTMVKNIADALRKNYYDPSFHGIDMDARFREAGQKIDQAVSFNQVFAAISWALDGLNDTHTYFVPPPRPTRYEYGWQMKLIGARCFVTAVKPGSDAEKKGLKPGDEILTVDGYAVTRATFSGLQRLFTTLIPQTRLIVGVRDGTGASKTLDIQAEIQERVRDMNVWGENVRDIPKTYYAWTREHRSQDKQVNPDVMVWKMNVFNWDSDVQKELDKTEKFKSVILDLRGNGGGSSEVLNRLIGGFFDHDVTIGETKSRKETKTWIAKTQGHHAFKGKLVVLVDSQTASASEIFARAVQIQKRGTVVGDQTEGAVLAARFFQYRSSPDNAQIVFYGAAIAEWDLKMTDGNRLEHVGVTPDESVLPTSADLAAQRDPVLARAAAIAGVTLTAEDAGKLFPVMWEAVVGD